MRIEKINENVVKVFVDSEDLASRSIELSQLRNNPSDYEDLILDIVEHAEIELGTAITEGHLMVECFTGEKNNLIVTITKRDSEAPGPDGFDPVNKKINEHIHNLTSMGLRELMANRQPSRFSRFNRRVNPPVNPQANSITGQPMNNNMHVHPQPGNLSQAEKPDHTSGDKISDLLGEDLSVNLKHNDYDIVLFPKSDDLLHFVAAAQSFTGLTTSLYTLQKSFFLVIRVTKKNVPLVNRLETKIADYNATYVPSDVFYPLLQEKGKKLISKNAIATLINNFDL
ncbi:MAG: adaptor protein MecA [Ruminococcaceae bacterium]|nr:adaptor protein MecA [Oscillospiraceae bacterium]